MTNQRGEAYAFFYCNAQYDNVNGQLPDIKERTQSPSNLELSLTEVKNIGDVEEPLKPVVDEARNAGMNYMLKASMSNTGNRKVADELGAVMNNVYASHLYQRDETFNSRIVYKRGQEYVFKRN